MFTLRPVGIAAMLGLITYMINPSWMAWSSVSLPEWLRWAGVGLGVIAGGLLMWTLRNESIPDLYGKELDKWRRLR